ncbi:phosphatidate phosphatase APP1 [Hasllibacter halocynthiae]|uniref:Phosphatidate phosphatase APP1 n=1 Tax=Hasllibacter halocynthiae TaxID=595589 RepID=A0A2T0X342_9RHOB|nr:phosphatase domain-containing protein [Hasllibacter halocynthiae]PRY93369.1 phosphatidate phosphatase APP1 [Hasllibacter halocynthiae]
MSILPSLHRLALKGERALDRRVARRGRGAPVIDPYLGYATPETLVARGRVLTALKRGEAREGQSRLGNLRQMASLFLTSEVEGVTVAARGVTAVTDAEGYFHLVLPRGDALPGWTDIRATVEGAEVGDEASLPVLVARPDARFGIISDVDDTMIRTGAYSLAKNLWTSFTGNALTREVFADSLKLMEALSEDGRNPVFYVSSSPWNLHDFLRDVFARAGLPEGPLFLKDYGISETSLISESHGGHKGSAIETILAAHPDLSFVLIGDTGQHDAEVYLDAALRHEGRVRRVILREPGPGPDEGSRRALAALKAMGVPVHHGGDLWDLPELRRGA